MAEQTVTLRINADAQGLISGVALAKRETRGLGDEGQDAGRKLGGGIAAARSEIERTGTLINQVKGFVGGLAAAFVSFQSVKALASMADEWSDLTSLVKVNIGATEDANAVMERLTQVARGTYSSLRDTAQSFAANATTLNALGKSTQEQLEYTTALNNALVISGAKGEQFAQVQDALSKAMATGALRGEELNTVLGRGSAVAEALAAELGTSALELRQLGADGKITGDVIFTALVRRMGELEERAESMPATIGDAFTVFRNALLSTVGYADNAAGATNGIAEAIIDLADVISRPEVKEGFAAVAIGAVNAAAEVAKLFGEVKKVADFAGRLAGMKLTGWLDPDDLELGRARFRELSDELIRLQNGERSWAAVTEKQRQARIAYLKEEIATIQENAKAAIIYQEQVAAAAEDAENAAKKSAEEAERQRQASLDALRTIVTGSGDAENATRSLVDAQADLYTHLTKIADATDDVDAMLRSLTRTLADDATRAQMDYQDNLAAIIDLELQWMALGPLSEEQIAKLNEARAMAGELYRRDMEALNADTVREAERAAEMSARAWEDFSYGLADAVLDGSRGVKDYFKRLLDDLKRQIIASGLLGLFRQIFNVQGAGAAGFTSILGTIGGGLFGGAGSIGGLLSGAGGGFLTSLAGAISSGVSGGLMSLGGTLAGLGMGGLGGGLAWAGGSVATHGLIDGLGSSFMTGMGNLFGAGGGALMGIGQMIPAIAAIAGVAAAIQKISGGKLFGTSYGFDSAGRTLDFSATGASGQDRVTEVRQRSLFRGRRWRDTFSDLPDDVADAIGQFWDEVAASNIAIAGDAARTIDAQIRQEFDAEGNVTKTIVEVLGRTWEESLEEAMTRIAAENMIANIDAMLGTTVQRAITGPGTGVGPGTGPGFVGPDIKDPGFHDTIIKATQTVGEAFSIAERWRHDAELLAAGAQFLLLAATDIQRGAGLLGDEGGLTAITDLIEDLQTGSETLSETYARVAGSAALLDQALSLSGVAIEGTREHIVRLATAITDAAGGLETATALWQSYFANFYTAGELAAYQAQQLRTAADAAFAGAGLDITEYLDTGGMARFRAEFEAAMPTMSAEDIAAWLRAADALAAVTASARQIDAALADNAWQLYLDGLTETERATAELTRYYDDLRDSLIASGATAEQLAAVEEQRAVAMGRVIAANAEAAAQEQARLEAAEQAYRDFITGIWRETVQLSDYQAAMMDAESWRTSAIATAHEHARAAGMAGASEQALALIEHRASQLRAQALAQLREETQSLVDQLYGARGNDIGTAFSAGMESARNAAQDYWEQQRRSAETLQQYLDSMLLGDLSALSPAEQLAEAWSQLNAAVADGDADQATRLADVYLRLLRGHEASGEDYNSGFWQVRELLQGMLDNIGPIPDAVPGGADGSGYITAAGAEQIAAQNRLDLAVQLAQHLAELSGAVGQTVWELMNSMGVDLRQLTADLGISLQSITGETVLALVNMADLLGTDLLTLTGQLGVSLTDMGAGIRELATQTGVNLDALTVESVQALGGLANQLGIDLADIATSVGGDLGSLADSQSLLNQALQGEIDKLPDDQARALQEYFDNIVAATSEADANEAIGTMADYINKLDADIRDELAPYFDKVFPAKALTDLDYLTSINRQTADMATAMTKANGLLARIADNAMAANKAANIPSYAVGTYNVPATGPAILHAGEMVLPRPMADAMRQGNFGGGGDTRALETRLDAVIARLDRLDKTTAQGAQAVSQTIVTTGATSDRNADASRARHAQAQRRGVTA